MGMACPDRLAVIRRLDTLPTWPRAVFLLCCIDDLDYRSQREDDAELR